MIKGLKDAQIADGLPHVLAEQPWVRALSLAMLELHRKTMDYIDASQIYTAIDTVAEEVLDALAVFLNYAGEHGEIWIAFTLLLLLFRRTRKAGCAMATALVLYLVAGDCILKPLFARPRPCDVNTAITILVKRPHGHSFPSGHTASAFAAAFALWLQNRKLGVPALVLAAFIAFTRLYLYVHFPTDVLGGLVLGLALGALASRIVDGLANKPKKKQSV